MGEEAEHRESERDRLDGIIRTKEAKLIELGPQLASILSSTVPVQDYLGMPLSDKREQISLARLLLMKKTLICVENGLQSHCWCSQ